MKYIFGLLRSKRKNSEKVLTAVIFLLMSEVIFVFPQSGAETYVSGVISVDTTWGPTGSPYIVIGNLTVSPGANLTISGNVVVKVDPDVTITVRGGLKVQPSPGQKAVFTNNSTGAWNGILGNQARIFNVSGCIVSRALVGIEIENATDAIVEDVIFDKNSLDIKAVNSSLVLVNSTLNWSRVQIDAKSTLRVSNILRIYVGDMNGPLAGADMEVKDNSRRIYATEGFGGNSPKTDQTGFSPRILVTDRVYQGSYMKENRTFINVTVRNQLFPMREVNMSISHTEKFIITDTYLTVQKLVPSKANVSERVRVHIRVNAHGGTNTTPATNITVIELLSQGIKYVSGSSSRPVWVTNLGGKVRLQWNISRMNASDSWNVTYLIYSTQPGLLHISLIPPSCVNYTSNLTNKSHPMPDTVVEFVVAPLSVSITSPRPFEVWRINDRRYINWTSEGGLPPVRVTLSYRTLGSQQWVSIAENLPENGSYLWHLPMTVLGVVTIRAQARDSQGSFANETVLVIVIPRFLVIITPPFAVVQINATQEFTARAIEINGTPLPSDKVLFAWSLGGSNVGKIDPVVGNKTTFTAIGPGIDMLICIALYEGSPSAGIAAVRVPTPRPPNVNVLTPGWGDSYIENGVVEISWRISSVAAPFLVDISYSQDRINYYEIASGLIQPYEGTMNYTWQLPPGLNGRGFTIRVSVMDRFNQIGRGESGEFSILAPRFLRYVSGDNQTGDVCSVLGQPLIVQVVTEDMQPVEGVSIIWSFVSMPNGSTLHSLVAQDITDSAGYSSAILTLGERTGVYEVNATLKGSSESVLFRENAEPGPLKEAYIFPQSAIIDVDEVIAFALSLYDEYSNPISVSQSTLNWSVEGVGSVVNGTYSSPVPGEANISLTVTYKGSSITLHATVTVRPTDTLTGWILIGLVLFVFLLFLMLLARKIRRPPPEPEKKMKKKQKKSPEKKSQTPAVNKKHSEKQTTDSDQNAVRIDETKTNTKEKSE